MKKIFYIFTIMFTMFVLGGHSQSTLVPGKNGGTGKANTSATLEFLGDSLKFTNTFYHSLRFPASNTRHWLPAGLTGTLTTSAQVWLLDGNTVGSEKWIGTVDNFALPFRTNNTEKMRITPSGDVGIGTTTPSAKLDIVGSDSPLSMTSGTVQATALLDNATGTGVYFGTITNHDLRFYTNNGPGTLVIDNGGDIYTEGANFGAGTNAPSTKMHVNGASGFRYVDGNEGANKVLLSDANGVGSWSQPNLSIFASTTSAQLAGVISDETGSGALVFGTSPTFVTPALGTPSSGDISNCTGDFFTIHFETGLLSPADATTYYFSDLRLTPNTTATNFAYKLGYAYKIIGIRLSVGNNTVAGTTETSTLQVRNITQATSSSVGTFLTNGSTAQIIGTSFTGLNISVAATDEIALQFDAATWVTNPTTILLFATLICQKQ